MFECRDTENRRKRFYFSSEDDMYLLKEVTGQNPFEDPNRWNIVQSNILQITGKCINVRTLKDRVKNLVNKYLQKEKVQQFKSGIEEEIDERDDLLRTVYERMEEFKNIKPKSKNIKSQNSIYQKGFEAREAATNVEMPCTSAAFNDVENEVEILTTISSNNEADYQEQDVVESLETPPKRKKSLLQTPKNNLRRPILTPARKRSATGIKQASLNYLDKKNDRWFEIRNREIALQEQSQALQEKKFELESRERQKKIELDERKLEMQENKFKIEFDIFKNQQKLIEKAFKKCFCEK